MHFEKAGMRGPFMSQKKQNIFFLKFKKQFIISL